MQKISAPENATPFKYCFSLNWPRPGNSSDFFNCLLAGSGGASSDESAKHPATRVKQTQRNSSGFLDKPSLKEILIKHPRDLHLDPLFFESLERRDSNRKEIPGQQE